MSRTFRRINVKTMCRCLDCKPTRRRAGGSLKYRLTLQELRSNLNFREEAA